jgi:hypothetical protein
LKSRDSRRDRPRANRTARAKPEHRPHRARHSRQAILFVRLADPDQHREAITSRPLLLHAIGRQTQHAGQTTINITSANGEHHRARRASMRIAAFFTALRKTAGQLTDLDRWYRILSYALAKYLKGRQLDPPRRLRHA